MNKNKKPIRSRDEPMKIHHKERIGFGFDVSLKEVEIEKWIEVLDDALQSKNEILSKRFLY